MAVTREDLMRAGIGASTPQQEPRRGLLGGFFGPDGRDARGRLAIALEGMTLNPNQGLVDVVKQGIEGRASEKQKNATIEWLKSRGMVDLVAALEAGASAGDVLGEATRRMQPPDPVAALQQEKLQIELDRMRNPQADPMDALEQEKLRLELEQMRNPQPEYRRATPEEAAAYGAQGGQFGPDGKFYAMDVPQGMTIESDGAGGFRMVQGAGVGGGNAKPFTEGQSKDVVFATRAKGALEVLEPVANELTSLGSKAAGYDPTGIIRGRVQSPQYQVARNAGDEFLQAILRKDTGAAITADEQDLYGATYLPQPGDGPEVLAAKVKARQRAIAAIGAGMSPAQLIAAEKALGGSEAPATGGPARVTSDAEYEALPAGTQFVGPDGKLRRKP